MDLSNLTQYVPPAPGTPEFLANEAEYQDRVAQEAEYDRQQLANLDWCLKTLETGPARDMPPFSAPLLARCRLVSKAVENQIGWMHALKFEDVEVSLVIAEVRCWVERAVGKDAEEDFCIPGGPERMMAVFLKKFESNFPAPGGAS